LRMRYSLGLDVGSVTAKLALVDADGGSVRYDVEKITASPLAAVVTLMSRVAEGSLRLWISGR